MDEETAESAWFAGLAPGDRETARRAVADGTTDAPADWPALAVETGFAPDEATYYETLHEVTVRTARAAASERRRADDQQLIQAVRAMDDCDRTANELAERVVEWATSRGLLDQPEQSAIGVAERLAETTPEDQVDERAVSLAIRTAALAEEAATLRAFVQRSAPDVAPNLAAMAGPVLAARLIALAGGLEPLARMPSGTVQVLGAEEALFAHLRGEAPSPKHGIIYVHEYVRNTAPANRGSAARALAGKLTIAARIDHYAGDRRPGLQTELDDRIARIRDRGDGDVPAGVEDA